LPWTNGKRHEKDYIYVLTQLSAKKGPPIPDELKYQDVAYEFIGLCLTPNVDERRSARELLNHPYPRVRTGTILLKRFSSKI
jgi:serine/threonine protein kinase